MIRRIIGRWSMSGIAC